MAKGLYQGYDNALAETDHMWYNTPQRKSTMTWQNRRQCLIAVNRKRSAIAFLSCAITRIAAVFAIVGSMIGFVPDIRAATGVFQFFTTSANTRAALAAALIIPLAVEGIRKNGLT